MRNMDHWLLLLILGVVGFSVGIIDTLTGGGGLPPAMALGTNKIQSFIDDNLAVHQEPV